MLRLMTGGGLKLPASTSSVEVVTLAFLRSATASRMVPILVVFNQQGFMSSLLRKIALSNPGRSDAEAMLRT